MPIDRQAVLDRLRNFDFSGLFTQELGWDWYTAETRIMVAKVDLTLKGVAEKRGVHVFYCPPGADGRIPESAVCAMIERQVAKIAREHLLIFTDAARTEQVWLYPRREPGKPIRLIRYRFEPGKANELLLQRLSAITFTLNEEEGLNLLGVVERLRDALDRDVVTKAFYQRFEKERAAFQEFLDGIPDESLERWYVAVMMNRLMFIYFIQQKGFLGDGDQRYLQNHLATCTGNYYKNFLCPLFFQGFALRTEDRPPEIRSLLGQVPYLNGGIFQQHEIETAHGRKIEAPNEAFARLFSFFDEWRWHLDERPIASGKEINPEILGYIFEKFINQKQMGAYYTKDDITGYISRNTIVPYLLDAARAKCKVAFENPGGPTVWDLLKNDPDRYIYPAVRHGVALPLPPEIAIGVDPKAPDLFERRKHWNKPAPAEYALPTEIWRETVARRQRYDSVKSAIGNPKSAIQINDLITLNLDICQFAQDIIDNCEGPDLLRALWHVVSTVSVLDPTCGSGAFLFAALNILEPLYEACLDRMEDMLTDEAAKHDRAKLKTTPRGYPLLPRKKFEDISLLLDRVAAHTNRSYFILKTIILNNLYGVDIMKEAVEICKLRLFLKLAAQVEPAPTKPNYGIEPLPDIDFNIRSGNTLVGFATEKQAEDVLRQDLLAYNTVWPEIKEEAENAAHAYQQFKDQQTQHGGQVTTDDKAALAAQFLALEDKLNRYLAEDYGVDLKKKVAFDKWLSSHQPFHWFIDFYGIMSKGGFDVIIGNPPYVKISKVDYQLRSANYSSLGGGNLYSLVVERSILLTITRGRFGMIVPVSVVSGEGFSPVALKFFQLVSWAASFSNRPGKLFSGVEQRLTVILGNNTKGTAFSSEYQHWYEEERGTLFEQLAYIGASIVHGRGMPLKTGLPVSASIARKIYQQKQTLAQFIGLARQACWFHDGPTYWIRSLPFEPKGNASARSSHYHRLRGADERAGFALTSLIASSTFYIHFKLTSNCRDFGERDLYSFRLPAFPDAALNQLAALAHRMGEALKTTSKRCSREYPSGTIEYDEYYPAEAKPIIDEIDRVLAKHYGFTEEELDFIINYDIKYRMGRDGGEEAAE